MDGVSYIRIAVTSDLFVNAYHCWWFYIAK